VLNKKNQPITKKILPFIDTPNAYKNLLDPTSPLLPTRNILSDISLDRKFSSSPEKLRLYEVRPEDDDNESENEEEKEEEIYEKEYKEKMRIETLARGMEEWLCKDQENIISNSDLMTNAFQKIEQFEIFLLFILDPLKKILESCVFFKYFIKEIKEIFYDSGLNIMKKFQKEMWILITLLLSSRNRKKILQKPESITSIISGRSKLYHVLLNAGTSNIY